MMRIERRAVVASNQIGKNVLPIQEEEHMLAITALLLRP